MGVNASYDKKETMLLGKHIHDWESGFTHASDHSDEYYLSIKFHSNRNHTRPLYSPHDGVLPSSSSVGLSCLEYMFHSSDVRKSSFPFSTCFLVAESIGSGRPMDSRKATAIESERLAYLSHCKNKGGGSGSIRGSYHPSTPDLAADDPTSAPAT